MKYLSEGARVRGFSLTELLITMTVVSILSAIALPTYRDYLEKGRRYEAQQLMMEQALALERIFTEQGRYPVQFTLPANSDFYQFSYSQLAQYTYLLKATPTRLQKDSCGTLTLDHTGYRAAARSDCWGS
ncbi:type IV pilin protein [Aeromonas enteropelogenes]|uniref:type IV pilin protein n=1 Tax=Aeromonas enteropelogenes TaxID=29489 RepID=UPI00398A2234